MRKGSTASLRLYYVSCNLTNISPWMKNQNSLTRVHHFAEYSVRLNVYTVLRLTSEPRLTTV